MLFDFKNAKNGRLFAILTLKHVNADREYWFRIGSQVDLVKILDSQILINMWYEEIMEKSL